jgi:hypothetical protein
VFVRDDGRLWILIPRGQATGGCGGQVHECLGLQTPSQLWELAVSETGGGKYTSVCGQWQTEEQVGQIWL